MPTRLRTHHGPEHRRIGEGPLTTFTREELAALEKSLKAMLAML